MEGVVVTARRNGATFTVSVVSNAEGVYSFPRTHVEPGAYDLTIRARAGFKEYVQQQITLNVSDIRDLGRISLAVGAVTETVQVTAAATVVNVSNAEVATTVSQEQIRELPTLTRNPYDLVTLAGNVTGTNPDDTQTRGTG